jgi:CRP/FNR family cyclic AMP-dependent transcriptional regulator
MATLEPMAMFNEVPVLDAGLNPATAVTGADSIIWHSSLTHLSALLQRYPHIALGLLPILASRNRWLVSQYEDLSFRSVRARTAKLLLELSENGRVTIDRRQHPIHELATRTATVPEAISRSLGDLSRYGYIKCTRAVIRIDDRAELARLAQLNPDFSH